ncbi:MAG: flippase-like domain-containing protein [Actinobacteria bacterium]|nr:MAG: flippase-like domain-containing protein [Actinomycetota bacterium]
MIDQIQTIARAAGHAVELVTSHAASLNPWWLVAGVALHVLHQAVRIRGWFNIVRAAYPSDRRLRYRDVIAAYYAGSGLNAVIPARGGDALKVFMVKRRLQRGRYSTLVATFVPETLFETLLGAALLVWMFARGFLPLPTSRLELPTLDVSLVVAHPVISTAVAAVLATGLVLLFRLLRRSARSFLVRLRLGLAILRTPRAYLEGVVTWQALGRVIRLGSLACLLAAPPSTSWSRGRCWWWAWRSLCPSCSASCARSIRAMPSLALARPWPSATSRRRRPRPRRRSSPRERGPPGERRRSRAGGRARARGRRPRTPPRRRSRTAR